MGDCACNHRKMVGEKTEHAGPIAGSNPAAGAAAEILDPFCDPANPRLLSYEMIKSAKQNIEGQVVKTNLIVGHHPVHTTNMEWLRSADPKLANTILGSRSVHKQITQLLGLQTPPLIIKSKLSNLLGMNIYIKTEFMQYTGSFKERGARNALTNLPPEQRKAGAVAASAGNHALAMCYHGQQMGIPITVVMPTTAPIMKIQNCKTFGAEVVVQGNNLGEAKALAQKIAQDKGAMYVNGYDHLDILAGQGTIGIEILEQLPNVSAVLVPTGGGGLIAGISCAIKTLKPCTKVIGVESENCQSFTNSLKAGYPVLTTTLPTLADGLAVALPGVNSVFTAKNYVDKMIVVKEDDIAVAILRLIEKEKYVVEGAGATGLAAIASGQLDEFKGKNIAVVLSGGNIDSTVLGRVLERGLAADGRYLKVYVTVSDRPGGVAELSKLISSIGVAIKNITQERTWLIVDVFSVVVKVVCETRDWDHAKELEQMLRSHYKNVKMVHIDFPPSTRAGKEDA